MHMKTRKRFLALTAVAAMVLAPCTAFATDSVTSPAIGGESGDGKVEGWVNKEVFTVVLPTVQDGALDFILDPQGLIKDTTNSGSGENEGAYSGKKFGVGTLFFKHAVQVDGKDYTNTSDTLTITNKSSIPVDVKVDVVATGDAVAFTTDAAFTESTNAEVYLAIQDLATDNAICIDPETETATLTAQLKEVDAQFFEVKYENGQYTYKLKTTGGPATSDLDKIEFVLTGAANPNGDWSSLTNINPGVDVVWTVSAVTSTQKISSVEDIIAWTNRDEAYTFEINAAAFGHKSVIDFGVYYNKTVYGYAGTWGGIDVLDTAGFASLSGNTITLEPKLTTFLPRGASLYVKFDDGSQVAIPTAE